MSDDDNLIVDAATRIFQDLVEPGVINDAEAGIWPETLWNTLEESGLTLAWGDEALGGAGVDMLDGFALLKVQGRFSAPVPMAETMMAAWLLGHGGIELPAGPMSFAPTRPEARIALGPDGALKGSARFVPFGRTADHIAVLARRDDRPVVALVKRADCAVVENASLAGEPSDDIAFDDVRPLVVADAPDGLDEDGLCAFAAAVRAMQMAGGLEKILEQSVQYAVERTQFGRPISGFQAIQHGLARLAGEVAAAGAAADAAAEAVSASRGLGAAALPDIAAAKSRVGEAATTGAAIAHQTHGAMGFTYEHTLHHATRRLWAWRDEFGNETYWGVRLGQMVAANGPDNLWAFVTGD